MRSAPGTATSAAAPSRATATSRNTGRTTSTSRLREGDAVLAAFAGSTRARCVFFSNFGVAYTSRIVDVPASTGYGEPIQRLFKLKDGEKIVAALSLDARVAGNITPKKEGDAAPV